MFNTIIFFPRIYLRDLDTHKRIKDVESIPDNFYEQLGSAKMMDIFQFINLYLEREMDFNYDEMPQFFVDLNRWPHNTNLLCWFCMGEYKSQPFPIPNGMVKLSIDNQEKIGFYVRGLCCSPNCAMGYIIYINDDEIANKRESIKQIEILHAQFMPNHNKRMVPARLPFCMKKFCGKSGLSIYKYREYNKIQAF